MKVRWFMVIPFLLALAGGGYAEEPGTGRGSLAKPTGAKGEDTETTIDINNIEMFVTNIGAFAYDVGASRGRYDGLYFPRGTEKHAVYASGIWIGAKVRDAIGDTLRVATAEFSQEFGPGKMINDTTWDNPDKPEYRVYKISKALNPDADGNYEYDWDHWPVEDGAPVDSLGNPLILGDQSLWCVYNDADPERHVNMETDALGLEVQQNVFAFNRTGALGYTVFLKFVIINKGFNTLDSTYVALWCDPDLGGASDDLVGCDTTLSLGYCYNATNNDNVYLRRPPAVGYDFFQGPIVPSAGDTAWVSGRPVPDYRNLPMTSFNKYINGTDPLVAQEVYWYMMGLDAVVSQGGPYINPVTGEVTTYAMSGDPVLGTGWLDSDPADRRFMLCSGPFTMAPGDTQEVVGAIIVGQGKDRLSSISALKFYDQFAQDAFDKNFDLPAPPPPPVVKASPGDGKVVLSWGTRSQEEYEEPKYSFEGYNVYQGASVAGPWERIATYDLVNNIRIVEDIVFDVDVGYPVLKPVQFGADVGLSQSIEITEDAVLGGSLKNGKTYYFAVTAYSLSETESPKTLENAVDPIPVVPQGHPAGTVISPVTVSYSRVDPNLPPTTNEVEVSVVNRNAVTGDDYKITFSPVVPPFQFVSARGESITVNYYWNLLDETTDDTLLQDQYYLYEDEALDFHPFKVLDGLLIKVLGSYRPELQNVSYENLNTAHDRGLSWVNWGLCCFGGAAGYGINFFGSTLDPATMPDSFFTVEFEFTNDLDSTGVIGAPAGQKAYKYDRPGYAYTGFYQIPITVWKVVGGERVMQLNACFVEDSSSGIMDNIWNPDASELGGREYLFIMKSQYDENGGVYDDDNWGPEADVLYAGGFRLRGATGYIDQGDVLRFQWAVPADDNDVFSFSTKDIVTTPTAQAKSDLKKIRAVPNPYFNHSLYEIDQFHRVVKFTNLPKECTIRVFNLAGDLVRTLVKDDPTTSLLTWNLLTEKELPVASGIYVYHVDAPGVGSTFGKMAIFMEKEQLRTW
jgi:hypothetical protein